MSAEQRTQERNARLTQRQSMVWHMRHEQKMSMREISRQLNIDRSTVRRAYEAAERKIAHNPLQDTHAELPDLQVSAGTLMRLEEKKEAIVAAEGRELRDPEVVRLLTKKIDLALVYLDDQALADAKAKDLADIVSKLIDKRQLLMGEPTSVVSIEDRRQRHELLDALKAELERRQKTIDVTPNG